MKKNKQLRLLEVFCIASGAMISSGLFVLPAVIYPMAGPSILLAYFVAGILMIPNLISQTELATAMPKAGGAYFYIGRSLGPMLGNFAGMANWFSIALKGAFALVGMGAFVQIILPGIPLQSIKWIAIGLILFFTLINLISVEGTGHIQDIMVILLIGILLYYISVGQRAGDFGSLRPFFPGEKPNILGMAGMVFISYGGLTKVASLAGEINDPGKTLPRGMILSFVVVNLLYLGSIFVTLSILNPQEFGNTLTPLTMAAQKFGGSVGMILLSLAALFSFATTANASLLSASRLPGAMAEDGLLPSWFGIRSKKRKIPWVSVLFTSLFMALVILGLKLEDLVKTASTMMLLLFFLVNLSVILMRESRIVSYRPIFKSPMYPYLQFFGLISTLVLIFKMGNLPLVLTGGFFVFSTLVYILFHRNKGKRDSALVRIVERVVDKTLRSNSLHDELTQILFERDNIEKDRFDHLISRAIILDIHRDITRPELFKKIAQALSLRLDIPVEEILQKLEEREAQSPTAISDDLAIPHIVLEEDQGFEIVMVRLQNGISFGKEDEKIKMVFALAGGKSERNFHLQCLMAIAQIVRTNDFIKGWQETRDEEELRALVMLADRNRK
ncbi:MAG: amino acid permease [Spirochaetaceae bacterium]|jgi:APA family basic amino acid/polyamine antiporter|nr:amino acid permease [Spirochaetaceae bacterium]